MNAIEDEVNGVEKAVNGVTALGTIIMHIVKYTHLVVHTISISNNEELSFPVVNIVLHP